MHSIRRVILCALCALYVRSVRSRARADYDTMYSGTVKCLNALPSLLSSRITYNVRIEWDRGVSRLQVLGATLAQNCIIVYLRLWYVYTREEYSVPTCVRGTNRCGVNSTTLNAECTLAVRVFSVGNTLHGSGAEPPAECCGISTVNYIVTHVIQYSILKISKYMIIFNK